MYRDHQLRRSAATFNPDKTRSNARLARPSQPGGSSSRSQSLLRATRFPPNGHVCARNINSNIAEFLYEKGELESFISSTNISHRIEMPDVKRSAREQIVISHGTKNEIIYYLTNRNPRSAKPEDRVPCKVWASLPNLAPGNINAYPRYLITHDVSDEIWKQRFAPSRADSDVEGISICYKDGGDFEYKFVNTVSGEEVVVSETNLPHDTTLIGCINYFINHRIINRSGTGHEPALLSASDIGRSITTIKWSKEPTSAESTKFQNWTLVINEIKCLTSAMWADPIDPREIITDILDRPTFCCDPANLAARVPDSMKDAFARKPQNAIARVRDLIQKDPSRRVTSVDEILNPIGLTGKTGRSELGKWGPNHAQDLLITVELEDDGDQTNDGDVDEEVSRITRVSRNLYMVAILRDNDNNWAMPGGMVEFPTKVEARIANRVDTAIRELFEEAFANESPDGESNLESETSKLRSFITQELGKSENSLPIYKGYVDDPRNTNQSWMETSLYHVHVDATNDQRQDIRKMLRKCLKSGDDAAVAMLLPLDYDNIFFSNMYASHYWMILLCLCVRFDEVDDTVNVGMRDFWFQNILRARFGTTCLTSTADSASEGRGASDIWKFFRRDILSPDGSFTSKEYVTAKIVPELVNQMEAAIDYKSLFSRQLPNGVELDPRNTILLLIDPQNDFMCPRLDPTKDWQQRSDLYHGSLYVKGSVLDGVRISHLLDRSMNYFSRVIVTQDWHPKNHISVQDFWRMATVNNGKVTVTDIPVFTKITSLPIQNAEDGAPIRHLMSNKKLHNLILGQLKSAVSSGGLASSTTFEVSPPLMTDDNGKYAFPADFRYMEVSFEYIKGLDETERMTHTVWPLHCHQSLSGQNGEHGSAIFDPIQRRLQRDHVSIVRKGLNPLVEMYSAVVAEVNLTDSIVYTNFIRANGEVGRQIKKLEGEMVAERSNVLQIVSSRNVRTIVVCGEALTHCVRRTIEHFAERVCKACRMDDAQPESCMCKQIVVLLDMTSPIRGETAPEKNRNMKNLLGFMQKMHNTGRVHFIKSVNYHAFDVANSDLKTNIRIREKPIINYQM